MQLKMVWVNIIYNGFGKAKIGFNAFEICVTPQDLASQFETFNP